MEGKFSTSLAAVFKKMGVYLRKRKPSGTAVWEFGSSVEQIVLAYEIITVLGFLPLRYLFLGDMVDCTMDGVQNDTQLRNQTYLNTVRSFCGTFGVPPNYGRLETIDKVFIRIEPRNETFVESMDYFLEKEKKLYDFKTLCWYLIVALIFQVNLSV